MEPKAELTNPQPPANESHLEPDQASIHMPFLPVSLNTLLAMSKYPN